MSDKYITIDITPAGNTTVEAHNFQGMGCADATQQIEIAIGGMGTKKKTPKPEYYESAGSCTENKNVF